MSLSDNATFSVFRSVHSVSIVAGPGLDRVAPSVVSQTEFAAVNGPRDIQNVI